MRPSLKPLTQFLEFYLTIYILHKCLLTILMYKPGLEASGLQIAI
jgi:hypothetical protein